MKAVVGKTVKTNKTGSELSRRFSKPGNGNGSTLVSYRTPALAAREPLKESSTQRPLPYIWSMV
jgi:hypothetical protein